MAPWCTPCHRLSKESRPGLALRIALALNRGAGVRSLPAGRGRAAQNPRRAPQQQRLYDEEQEKAAQPECAINAFHKIEGSDDPRHYEKSALAAHDSPPAPDQETAKHEHCAAHPVPNELEQPYQPLIRVPQRRQRVFGPLMSMPKSA